MKKGIMKAKTSNLYYHEKIIDIGSICEVIKKDWYSYIMYSYILYSQSNKELASLGLALAGQLEQIEIWFDAAQMSIENIFTIEQEISGAVEGKFYIDLFIISETKLNRIWHERHKITDTKSSWMPRKYNIIYGEF